MKNKDVVSHMLVRCVLPVHDLMAGDLYRIDHPVGLANVRLVGHGNQMYPTGCFEDANMIPSRRNKGEGKLTISGIKGIIENNQRIETKINHDGSIFQTLVTDYNKIHEAIDKSYSKFYKAKQQRILANYIDEDTVEALTAEADSELATGKKTTPVTKENIYEKASYVQDANDIIKHFSANKSQYTTGDSLSEYIQAEFTSKGVELPKFATIGVDNGFVNDVTIMNQESEPSI